ncbi:hypothetical protein RD110_20310 [Rhodoferax koreense]|uniref:DUF2059 domain-containing protein n=1 Tax=Rhodoferax koreensis TaxID=1842727 RepID=A0A1P8JZS3_9BURK|nr:DUF2059 domain-containing protein [Rhodoferax koreense]APW39268.1 hypothetical protein RD110_20310 [Rhodoferax koreense]
MRKTLLALALLTATLACRAEPPSTESVEALLVATKSEAIMESVNANMENTLRQGMAQTLAGRKVTPQLQRFLDKAPRQFAEAMKEEMSWATLKPLYVQLYQESFTQEEVDGLVAFYRSPAGEALTNKMPIVMQKTMALVQSRVAPMMEKMRIATARAMAEAQSSK